jgi:hypothetical protein
MILVWTNHPFKGREHHSLPPFLLPHNHCSNTILAKPFVIRPTKKLADYKVPKCILRKHVILRSWLDGLKLIVGNTFCHKATKKLANYCRESANVFPMTRACNSCMLVCSTKEHAVRSTILRAKCSSNRFVNTDSSCCFLSESFLLHITRSSHPHTASRSSLIYIYLLYVYITPIVSICVRSA